MKKCCENVKTPHCPTCGSKIVIPPVFDDDVQKVAVMLHDMFCTWNHTDGCAWHYEVNGNNIHNWSGNAHTDWYEKAQTVLKTMAINEFIEWKEEAKFIKKVVNRL